MSWGYLSLSKLSLSKMGKYNTLGMECEQLFCEGNTFETINQITGVSLRTLSIWKNQYDWDRKRKQYQQQPIAIHTKIKKVFTGFLDELLEKGIQSSKQSDSVAKLAKAMNTTGGIEDIPGMAVTIMTDFTKFVNKNNQDEEFKEKLFPIIHSYFQYLKGREYGIEQ